MTLEAAILALAININTVDSANKKVADIYINTSELTETYELLSEINVYIDYKKQKSVDYCKDNLTEYASETQCMLANFYEDKLVQYLKTRYRNIYLVVSYSEDVRKDLLIASIYNKYDAKLWERIETNLKSYKLYLDTDTKAVAKHSEEEKLKLQANVGK